MGTRYLRDQVLPPEINVAAGDSLTLNVDHIYSEEVLGNTLSISLRQPSAHELGFVLVSLDASTHTEILISPDQQQAPGTYQLYL